MLVTLRNFLEVPELDLRELMNSVEHRRLSMDFAFVKGATE